MDKETVLLGNITSGAPNGNFRENICSEDDWIMCELGVFPIFLENDLTFFKARKDLEGFNAAFFNLL